MKSFSAIQPAIKENTVNMLVKRAPHMSIRESHNVSISAMLNSTYSSKQGIAREVPHRSFCPILKPFRVYHKSSLYTAVKKEWEIKGVQRQHPDASTVAAVVGTS